MYYHILAELLLDKCCYLMLPFLDLLNDHKVQFFVVCDQKQIFTVHRMLYKKLQESEIKIIIKHLNL